MLLSGNPGTETRITVFIDGRLVSSIPELNYQTIDKLQQGGVPDKVSWMKPSLRGKLRLVKTQGARTESNN